MRIQGHSANVSEGFLRYDCGPPPQTWGQTDGGYLITSATEDKKNHPEFTAPPKMTALPINTNQLAAYGLPPPAIIIHSKHDREAVSVHLCRGLSPGDRGGDRRHVPQPASPLLHWDAISRHFRCRPYKQKEPQSGTYPSHEG